jgi:S1-C subfamily serine protease
MLKRISTVLVLFVVAAPAAIGQAQQQSIVVTSTAAPPWIVSVVHEIDSNEMVARLSKQGNVRVGVPGVAPQKIFNVTTGLVVDGKGHIVARLSNLDPADKNELIYVTLNDGSRLAARLIGIDCATGFAVLEVPSLKVTLPSFASTTLLAKGAAVKILSADAKMTMTGQQMSMSYAIKQNVGQVGAGSIYAKSRGALTLNAANLLARNDGGIVTTYDNELAGIAQYAGYGRAYLFPFEFIRDTIAKRVIDKQDSVPGGWLGVKVDGLTQMSELEFSALGLPQRAGVIVREVVTDSPAAASGLQPNDVIVGLDSFDITSETDLSAVLSSLPAGHNLKLRAIRKKDPVAFQAVLRAKAYTGPIVSYFESEVSDQSPAAQRDILLRRRDALNEQYRANQKAPPSRQRDEVRRELTIELYQLFDKIRELEQQTQNLSPAVAANNRDGDPRLVFFEPGFAARDLDRDLEPQLAEFFGVSRGVLVVSVVKAGLAETAGIKAGDVIVGTNQRTGLSCQQLEREIA